MDRSDKKRKLGYKCATENTSAILQHAAHTTDKRGDNKVESSDSSEIPDWGEDSSTHVL